MADLLQDRQRKLNTAVALTQMTVARGCTPNEAASAQERLNALSEKYRFTAVELATGYLEHRPSSKQKPVEEKPWRASRTKCDPKYRSGRMWRPQGGTEIPIEEMDDNHLMNAFILLSERLYDPAFTKKWPIYKLRLSWLADEAQRRGMDLSDF
ncbi:MAG: hypothetical protein KF784_03255 [Fimbriimonadaceae bacterium]|nr:hypothetical protein [Fimbriimonadaceae bacterium]